MKHRLLISLEAVLADQGGDEIPLWEVLDKIRQLRYCAEVSELELVGLVDELTEQELYEAMLNADGHIDMSSLIWKSEGHPTMDDPDNKPILL